MQTGQNDSQPPSRLSANILTKRARPLSRFRQEEPMFESEVPQTQDAPEAGEEARKEPLQPGESYSLDTLFALED